MRTGLKSIRSFPRTQARLLGPRARRRAPNGQSGQSVLEYVGLVLLVAAIIGALVATGVGPALTDKFVAQVECVFGGSCESGELGDGPVAQPPQEGAPQPGAAPATDAPPPGPPPKTQTQIDYETAVQELETARTDLRTSEDKAKAIAKELAEILADELGLKNPFECVMTGDLGTCGQAVIDVLLGLIGGVAGKFAKKYYKPWDWDKAAGKIKKVLGLAWDLKGKIGDVIDARGKLKNAEDKLNAAKTKLDAENAAKPKPEEPKKPEQPKNPDEEEEEPEQCAVPHSFLARTPVLFGDGTRRPIETVRLGDRVVATDPLTGRTAVRPVTRTFRTTDDKHFTVLTVLSGGRTQQLTATDTHPFWLTDLRRWVDAGDITAGSGLRTPEGRTLLVTAVGHYTQRQTTYDLTVGELHTYYVGVGGGSALVHNNDFVCGLTDLDEAERRFPGLAHTVSEHVRPTPQITQAKLNKSGINTVWRDQQTAQAAVDAIMADPKIQTYIKNKLRDPRTGQQFTLPVRTFGSPPLGTFVKADGSTGPTGNYVTIVIQRAKTDPAGHKVTGGWYVYTAYPE